MANKEDNTKNFLIVGGLIAAYLIISKLGNGFSSIFSTTPTPDLSKQNKVVKTPTAGLDASSYTYTLSQIDADNLAATIYDAMGYITDDFSSIMGAIKQCQTLGDVAEVKLGFQNAYNVDFWTYLEQGKGILPENGLSGDQMTEINDYINSLPN